MSRKRTPESIRKMIETRKANKIKKAASSPSPDVSGAIWLLRNRVKIIADKPYRELDENELAILAAHRALTLR
jgi:hypothetical protein